MEFKKDPFIAVIGLGYVGLPLAVGFAEKYRVVGFDINKSRVLEVANLQDSTLEVSSDTLSDVYSDLGEIGLFCTYDEIDLKGVDVFIITVPTPIDEHTNPDLTPLIQSSQLVSKYLNSGGIVIYESTVFPGATEEICVPVLEEYSGLKFNVDFYCGYSPERINPGDKEHTFKKILKVTSGSTESCASYVDLLYSSIVTAGTFKAASIKVAEAAKVIENSQRDINIAFVNELAIIFNKLGIDTNDVLDAASTKWNFLPFKPGLVGGHCIGVDPYYLAQKAKSVGYYPQMILSGRRLNNGMGSYIAKQMIKLLIHSDKNIKGSNILVLGITFKENCPDIRNTRVIDVVRELRDYQVNVDIFDPWASFEEVKQSFGLSMLKERPDLNKYDGLMLAVAHHEFLELFEDWEQPETVVFDVKSALPREITTARL